MSHEPIKIVRRSHRRRLSGRPLMAIPGGWLLTSWGAPVARAATLDALLAKAADHGLVQIEHRTARRTGDSFIVPRLERGTAIRPAEGRPQS